MKIDTNEIEHDFTIKEIDGFKLINAREIGIEVCNQHLDDDEIWEADLYYDIREFLDDIIFEALKVCKEALHENNREIDVFSKPFD